MGLVGKPYLHRNVLSALVSAEIQPEIMHLYAEVLEFHIVIDGGDAIPAIGRLLQVDLRVQRHRLPGKTAPVIEIEHDDLADHSAGQHDAGDLQEVSQLGMMGGYELSQRCHEFTHGGYYTEAAESWQQRISSLDKLTLLQTMPC